MDIKNLYNCFSKIFGDIGSWWPATNEYEIIMGCILTQNTTWENVIKSLKNFDEFEPRVIEKISIEKLKEKIKPSGFFNQKAIYLKEVTAWYKKYNYSKKVVKQMPLQKLKEELIHVKGIGKETRDSILLYAFDKRIMVVDAYTTRILNRLGILNHVSYEKMQNYLMKNLDFDVLIYKKMHGYFVMFAKNVCQKKPFCGSCPLKKHCKYYKELKLLESKMQLL